MAIFNDTRKKWLYVTLAAATLTLSACADKEAATAEDAPAYDAQSEVEQSATGVSTAEGATKNDVAVASADDAMAVGNNDDVAVATADDDVLDGSEEEEHVSTY